MNIMSKLVIIDKIKYLITNENDIIQNTLLNGIQWNKELINIIRNYIFNKKLKHFVNIGAHIGTVCIPIASNIDKITAIEAYPPSYQHLLNHIKLNNIKNITPINIAVGNIKQDAYFMNNDKDRIINNTGGMHVFTNSDIKYNRRSVHLIDNSYKIDMLSLDEMDISQFDIILVDIEGGEYPFLLGAKNKIKDYKPIIIIEIWDNKKRQMENMPTKQEDIISLIISMNYNLIKQIGNDFIFEPIKMED